MASVGTGTSAFGAVVSSILGFVYWNDPQQVALPELAVIYDPPAPKHPQDSTFFDFERNFPLDTYREFLLNPVVFGVFLAIMFAYNIAVAQIQAREKNTIAITNTSYRIGNAVTTFSHFLQLLVCGTAMIRSWPLVEKIKAISCISELKASLENEDILRVDGVAIWSFVAITSYLGRPIDKYLKDRRLLAKDAWVSTAIYLLCYGAIAAPPQGSIFYMSALFLASAIINFCEVVQACRRVRALKLGAVSKYIRFVPLVVAAVCFFTVLGIRLHLNEPIYENIEIMSVATALQLCPVLLTGATLVSPLVLPPAPYKSRPTKPPAA